MKILSGWFLLPSILFIFFIFLKFGFVFWSEGYILIPIMQKELVTHLHLLTQKEFIDGIALSQLTPGPVTILASIAGYRIAGIIGALTAIFAMFLPGTLLMLFISKSYDKIKNSNFAIKILNTIISVIVGLLVVTAWRIGQTTIHTKLEFAMFFLILFLIIRFRVKPALLIIASALLGFILHL